MSDESPFTDLMAASSPSNKVWELSRRVVDLYAAAAEVAADLQYYCKCWDKQEAKAEACEAVDRIGDLFKTLVSIREQEGLLRYFALAYKKRLGGWYVIQDNGKDFVVQRKGDDRPLEVIPLEYRYRSYSDKALDLVDQLLNALLVAGNDMDAVAEAVPYLLDLTVDADLVNEFVAELRQEAVCAFELATAEGGKDATLELGDAEQSQKRDGTFTPEVDIPGLSRNAVSVMRCLQDRGPALLTLESIAESTRLCRDTVSNEVIDLINMKLAHRPNGDRKGATLTDRGREIAAQIKIGEQAQIRR